LSALPEAGVQNFPWLASVSMSRSGKILVWLLLPETAQQIQARGGLSQKVPFLLPYFALPLNFLLQMQTITALSPSLLAWVSAGNPKHYSLKVIIKNKSTL
jgi:hypothetical protein